MCFSNLPYFSFYIGFRLFSGHLRGQIATMKDDIVQVCSQVDCSMLFYPMSLQSRYVHHIRSHSHIPRGLVCDLWEQKNFRD